MCTGPRCHLGVASPNVQVLLAADNTAQKLKATEKVADARNRVARVSDRSKRVGRITSDGSGATYGLNAMFSTMTSRALDRLGIGQPGQNGGAIQGPFLGVNCSRCSVECAASLAPRWLDQPPPGA
jgi:hypothetical protein